MLRGVDELVPIGDFSQRSGLSPKRLRTYAAAGLLRPVAVDPSSGYRYYSLTQLRDARLIDALRAAGMSLADVSALLDEPSTDRLDEWSRQVQVDAEQRQQALGAARALLSAAAVLPDQGLNNHTSGDSRMITLTATARSERGRTRDNNEDAVFAGARLMVVADGMGGHQGGEIASQLAVSLVTSAYTGHSIDELQAGVRAASRAVWERAASAPDLEGMGTTVCAAGLIAEDSLALVHVGDSRAYVWRDGALQRLTRDHTVTADLVDSGGLSESEVARHPLRGCLTRAVGVAPDVELSAETHHVSVGDRILLCTDGLCNDVHDDAIADVMASNGDVDSVADALVKLAQAGASGDDVTVAVADIRPSSSGQ